MNHDSHAALQVRRIQHSKVQDVVTTKQARTAETHRTRARKTQSSAKWYFILQEGAPILHMPKKGQTQASFDTKRKHPHAKGPKDSSSHLPSYSDITNGRSRPAAVGISNKVNKPHQMSVLRSLPRNSSSVNSRTCRSSFSQ